MAKKNPKKEQPKPEDYGVTEAEYQQMPESLVDSLMRPLNPVDEANEAINNEYPWAVPSLTGPQRAILCELYRIRKLLEK